jgi:hypothetical protein
VLDDVRQVTQCLDVVDDRRLAEEALDRGEWRLDARPAAFAFDGLEQAGLLAADVGARAAVQVAVDLEWRDRRSVPAIEQPLIAEDAVCRRLRGSPSRRRAPGGGTRPG